MQVYGCVVVVVVLSERMALLLKDGAPGRDRRGSSEACWGRRDLVMDGLLRTAAEKDLMDEWRG